MFIISRLLLVSFLVLSMGFASCNKEANPVTQSRQDDQTVDESLSVVVNDEMKDQQGVEMMNGIEENDLELATFGAGCFWCVEAVFQELKGVSKVVSGYMGGQTQNPTYQEICTGATGHAEVCQISYNPAEISFAELLEVFWKTHDPTTLNRQGNDKGTQYRSAVFYHNDDQKNIAEEYKQKLDASGAWDNPLTTEISSAETFYEAEKYHQDYYSGNGFQPYCMFVIRPKMDKFRQAFADKLKSN